MFVDAWNILDTGKFRGALLGLGTTQACYLHMCFATICFVRALNYTEVSESVVNIAMHTEVYVHRRCISNV